MTIAAVFPVADNVLETDEIGKTQLHRLSFAGLSVDEIAEILRRNAEFINHTDAFGQTPLMCAADSGDLEKCKALLKVPGIDLNITDITGLTALHHAIKSAYPNREIVIAIVGAGTNHTVRDVHGRNISMFSICNLTTCLLYTSDAADE